MADPSNQQIRSIIERMPRPAFASIGEARAALTESDDRHRYCLRPLLPHIKSHSVAVSRAISAAGRMLGCRSDIIRHRAGMWRRLGTFEQCREFVIGLNGKPWSAHELPEDCVGYVYVLRSVERSGLFKVGYSQDPQSRCRRLEQNHKTTLELVHTQIGAWIDEHLAHASLGGFAVANEWFDLSGGTRRVIPTAMFMQPAFMWRHLKSLPAPCEAA